MIGSTLGRTRFFAYLAALVVLAAALVYLAAGLGISTAAPQALALVLLAILVAARLRHCGWPVWWAVALLLPLPVLVLDLADWALLVLMVPGAVVALVCFFHPGKA